MSLEQASSYCARGRGERKRPAFGWGSLTPTELEVVRHVAQGCTNPEVARRLFVSRVVGGVAAAAAVGTVGYGTYGVLRGPKVKRVTEPFWG